MYPVLAKSSALVTQKFREFFWPTVLATLALQVGTILDSIIVGNLLGPDAMAGVGVCMPLTQILGAISGGAHAGALCNPYELKQKTALDTAYFPEPE